MDRFAACFEDLEDPRTGNAALHDFHTLLIIALCTVLCGGQGCVDMALFAQAKEPFLRDFLDLKNGPPSDDTFSRLFRRLDPDQFRVAFQRFMTAFCETCQGVLAIDGKVLRRSFDRASKKSALHMVSAWGCELGMVLAQIATDAKSNEITAVPELLKMLSLKNTIVTVDALNCQRAIAQQIVDQGGDYALALKGNQGTLHADVSLYLDDPAREAEDTDTTVDADNGRIETRTATVTTDIGWLQHHRRGWCASAKSPVRGRPPPKPRSRPRIIPAILRIDPCPGATGNRIDALRVSDEEVPSLLAGGDNGPVAVPDTPAELVATQVVPDVLHRVEFWRVGWQRQERDVVRRAQALARLMPSGTITDQDSMCAWRDLCADLLQMLVHRLGIDGGHDDCRADSPRVADRAEQVGRVMAVVAHHRWT